MSTLRTMTDVDAVVLVGHGAVPADCPRDLVTRLKALEGRRRATGTPVTNEEMALDTRIRAWPRTAGSDPYGAGLEALASSLRPLLGTARLVVAYNEFCAPTLEEAVAALAADGAHTVVVVPSMLTPGGVHSEIEIPETIARLRAAHPTLALRYAWPFDLDAVAALLADHIRR
ncbi:MAG TPA: CbiX/SirB N-terminal domain-containing protein [Candidatus Binatia bacterium]|nr:CbiX/SirB N-terminal domain-containing protein [Candidatus Binatia bacterium]